MGKILFKATITSKKTYKISYERKKNYDSEAIVAIYSSVKIPSEG